MDYYDDRQLSTKEALKELEDLVSEYNQARRAREEKGLDTDTSAIYWILQKNTVSDCDNLALKVKMLFDEFQNYKDNAGDMRELKTKLYKSLTEFGIKDLQQARKITESLIKLKTGRIKK
ncbi:MAG: hypothetical protein WAM14_10575 [Candidatus Nitrosopolaris sp.]